ncbi:MAG: carbohydrate ABC transporter permease [Spirochaetaceae bacterium]
MSLEKKEAPVLDFVVVVVLILTTIVCLVPMVHVLARSFSSETAIVAGKIKLLPVDFQLAGYDAVFKSQTMMNSLMYTIFLTVLGTIINVVITAMGAYPLAQKDLVGKKFIWLLIIVTMFFSGGLIPLFLVVRSLGILDTVWALVLPGTVSTFNLILMKTYFQGLPPSLIESARMDGCPEILILFKIILPLAAPMIATLGLFYGMGNWNVYMPALIYMSTPEKFPLQLMLYRLLDGQDTGIFASMGTNPPVESIKSASVFFVILPVLIIFPFLQKYFTQGALLGSVKE